MNPEGDTRSISSGVEHGSALVMAVFVLALLTAMGVALLFVSRAEVEMSRASVRSKVAFYLAEAAVEEARTSLHALNNLGAFDDDLATAAGVGGALDFDSSTVAAIRSAAGDVTSLTGFNDDAPLVTLKKTGDGWFAAFLLNDDGEPGLGRYSLADTNDRVLITGVGAGTEGSFEVVEAIVELRQFVPDLPPSAITLLGPSPAFYSGKSKVKVYDGDDCPGGGGVPGLYVPIVGTIGSVAEALAEAGMDSNPTYESGGFADTDTFADLTDSASEDTLATDIDPGWTNCLFLQDMVDTMSYTADLVCPAGSADTSCGGFGSSDFTYVNGDFTVGPGTFGGTLVVTGTLNRHGNAFWKGLILVIGEGIFDTYGGGNGTVSGGIVVADIAGPDGIYGTADDCTGGDAGFGSVVHDERGGGDSNMEYCTASINGANQARPYDVVEFRQR